MRELLRHSSGFLQFAICNFHAPTPRSALRLAALFPQITFPCAFYGHGQRCELAARALAEKRPGGFRALIRGAGLEIFFATVLGFCRSGLVDKRAQRCAEFSPTLGLFAAAEALLRRAAPSRARSQWLVSLNVRHVFLPECGGFPRERIRPPGWWALFPPRHRAAPARWFVSLA